MAPIRANTVMLSDIPEEYQSDAKLKEFFDVIFPGGKVKSAYCVKDTSSLIPLIQALEDAKSGMKEAEALKDNGGGNMFVKMGLARKHDKAYYAEIVSDLEPKVKEMRKKINEASATPGPNNYNCSTGFVTFHERTDAEVALRLDNISKQSEDWVIETPPEPSDILWADLMQNPLGERGRAILGYACLAGLFFAYIPIVVGMTNVANVINMGPLQPAWASIAPTFGLTFMVSMLPTFLMWIFKIFFTLKAEAWSQFKLQSVYFWFQMVFVVMAAAIGQNVQGLIDALVKDPLSIFGTLADTMPYATHFYMNFLVLAWSTHCTNLIRDSPLIKYKLFSFAYTEEEAKKKAEPESQDYYGIGARLGRWTANLNVCLVYGTLCPPMFVVGLLNFAISRTVYGYLILFAETKKPDLGGVFFVRSLQQIFAGLILYCLLMIGVLGHRSATPVPSFLILPALAYVIWKQNKFEGFMSWEKLPFHELMTEKGTPLEKRQLTAAYTQEELKQQ